MLQKVTSLDGTELSPENRTPIKIVYSGSFPSFAQVPPESILSPDVSEYESQPVVSEPVVIDRLPQTGPASSMILVLISISIFLIQKKLSKRA